MPEPTVRVHQVAAAAHVPLSEALEKLRQDGFAVRSGHDRLTHQQTSDALLSLGVTPASGNILDPASTKDIVLEAFATARDSGREDWRLMQPAVLKNRLLDITGRNFTELAYGAPTFTYFVSLLPDLLTIRVDDSGQTTIEIRESAIPDNQALHPLPDIGTTAKGRIREDLWLAFADFASGEVYVWDSSAQQACAGEPGPGRPQIPTLKPTEEAGWRSAFVTAVEGDLPEAELGQLHDWQARRLPSSSLPLRLRGAWNGWLRARMLDKIQGFFAEHSLVVPADLLASKGHAPSRPAVATREQDIRSYVQHCISLMSDDELLRLAIPVDVVIRANKKK